MQLRPRSEYVAWCLWGSELLLILTSAAPSSGVCPSVRIVNSWNVLNLRINVHKETIAASLCTVVQTLYMSYFTYYRGTWNGPPFTLKVVSPCFWEPLGSTWPAVDHQLNNWSAREWIIETFSQLELCARQVCSQCLSAFGRCTCTSLYPCVTQRIFTTVHGNLSHEVVACFCFSFPRWRARQLALKEPFMSPSKTRRRRKEGVEESALRILHRWNSSLETQN